MKNGKKAYTKPKTEVFMLESADIITMSNQGPLDPLSVQGPLDPLSDQWPEDAGF